MRILLAVGLSAFLLSGCGAGVDTDADLPRFDVPEQAKRKQFLDEFPLLDASGREAPSPGPSGKAFTGALVYMPLTGKGSYCTVSHLRQGEVLTNAHCVEDDSDASNYFIVFYDLNGEKKVYRIGNFIDVGSSENRDFARLRISNRAAREFPALEPQIPDLSSEIDRNPPAVHRVSIWSYDPLYRHAEQFKRYNHAGMMAKRSDCDMSRTKPKVIAVGNDGSRITMNASVVNTEIHLITNNCSAPLIPGNSGSAITAYLDDSVVYGTYHWAIEPKDEFLKTYSCFEFTVNAMNGKFSCVSTDSSGNKPALYGVGTALSGILN